jgi:hypothetical protein
MNQVDDLVQLLTKIETNYPEVYTYLDEDPLTLCEPNSPKVSERDMANYLESLREMLSQFKLSHKQYK